MSQHDDRPAVDEAQPVRLTPEARAEAQAVLDRAARRLLAEQLAKGDEDQ